jgi:hypothetical protein
VAVTVDERPATDARGGRGGAFYVWRHVGTIDVEAGTRHVDLNVTENSIVDAVLLTRDLEFSPADAVLPEPLQRPVVRAPRRYRSDAHLAALAHPGTGLVIAEMADPYEDHHNDLVPSREQVLETFSVWAAPGQIASGSVLLRALADTGETEIRLEEILGPHGTRIGPDQIDVRIAHLRDRPIVLYDVSNQGRVPDLLLRDDRTGMPPKGYQGGYGGGSAYTDIPAGESRQIWFRVTLPRDTPPGTYRGTLEVRPAKADAALRLPVEIEVLPIDLQPVEGFYGSFYRADLRPGIPGAISEEQFLADLQEHVRQGLNTVTLYPGMEALDLARQAGMTAPPILMHWPESNAPELVAEAVAMGFPDLYFWGVDEPRTPEQRRNAQQVGTLAENLGVHIAMAINSPSAYTELRQFVSRPILLLRLFDLAHQQEHVGVCEDARL